MKKRLHVLVGLLFVGGLGAGMLWPQGGPAPVHGRSASASTREDQKEVAVTIYNGNLGLIKDVREIVLPRGVAPLEFRDVAAQIDPTTVQVKSLTDPAGLRVIE